MHAPAAQRWPSAHMAPPPQLHRPAEQPSLELGSHELHTPPIAPHIVAPIGAHVSPSQHPVVHELASHPQRPDTQRWPGRQAAPAPQPHAPAAEHASASEASHVTQLAPAMPHVAVERSRQLAPSQHPDGHDVSSQTQSPTTHRWPPTHASPSPQTHVPSSAQRSVRPGSQRLHADAPVPHAITERGRQLGPEQHPSGQPAASQPEQMPAAHD